MASSRNKYICFSIGLFSTFLGFAVLLSTPSLPWSIFISTENNGGIPAVLGEYDRSILSAIAFMAPDDRPEQQKGLFQPLVIEQLTIYIINYGKDFFWIPAGLCLAAFGGWAGRKTATAMALSFIITALVVIAAKDAIERERPDVIVSSDLEKILRYRSEYSFPSGHASIVSAGAINALILFRGSKGKTLVALSLAFEAGLVCFMQIYVGVHYPLDIIGGILVGTSLSLACILFIKYLDSNLAKLLVSKFLVHFRLWEEKRCLIEHTRSSLE